MGRVSGLSTPSTRRKNPTINFALNPKQTGQMLHRLEERLQALEQDLADHRREMAEVLRLGRRLQAQGDATLWQLFDDLRSEVEALRPQDKDGG